MLIITIVNVLQNKQHILDPGEKIALGQCLDKLQQNIKVTSLSAMVERLEATARQLGYVKVIYLFSQESFFLLKGRIHKYIVVFV